MPTNQFDQAVELQLDLFRATTEIDSNVLGLLLALQKDLISQVANANYTQWGQRRIQQQLSEVDALIKQRYAEVSTAAQGSTSAIAQVSALATARSLSVSSQAALPSQAMLEAIASKSVVQGATQGAWWSRQSADTSFRFSQAVRQGLVAGETNQKIIQRVRSFMDTSKANASALVQTSVATVANDGRSAVFSSNQDIIKRLRAVATLDTNTCTTCAPLDGLEWTKARNPIGHKFDFPNYPKHFNCRCLLIPVVLDGPQGGTRASDAGQVDASLTFRGWLKRQPVDKQDEILGRGRAKLYRDGKITLADLTRGNGAPLTIDELKRKYA